MAKTKKGKSSVFKRLIGNKNTVTILGLLACVATLVIGYNYRVRLAIDPITVPYAKEEIPSRTLITADMVGRMKVARNYVSEAGNLIKSNEEVVGKYVSYKTNIPKGSLFYSESIKDAEEMPDSAFANIEDGYTIYSLAVNDDDTLKNSIRAGDYIDLSMSATEYRNSSNLVIYGTLIKSIRVLAVKDSRGNNIVKNTLTYGKPAELLFAVDNEMFLLLSRAEHATKGDIKIKPILRNKQYTIEGNPTSVNSEYLIQFINSQVETLS